MDEKLLGRTQAAGAALVCVSYFLPWASIVTPLGSIAVRGLYIDFAWVVLVLAMAHLSVQFAKLNSVALGLPPESTRTLNLVWKYAPLVFVAFFSWYAFGFLFRGGTAGAEGSIFGDASGPFAKAGLDYGFWIGVFGTVLTIVSVGSLAREVQRLGTVAVLVAAVAGIVVVGLRMSGTLKESPGVATANALSGSQGSDSASAPPPQDPTIDASPYVTALKISGEVQPKDIEASRFSDSIVISPVFKNVSSKTIVGLQGRISMIDGFGNEVYGFKFRDDDKMRPGERSEGGYKFDGNQFEDDDPYHKMLPLLNGGTAKYKWTISRIAFEDGSVVGK